MDKNEIRLRNELIQVNRILVERGLIRSSDENISVRLNRNFLLITPSGVYKSAMSPEDLIVIDMDGNIMKPKLVYNQYLKPSCTWKHTGSARISTRSFTPSLRSAQR